MNYARRVRALLAALETHNLDALLVTHLPNIRYLCGFTGSAGALVLSLVVRGSLPMAATRPRPRKKFWELT